MEEMTTEKLDAKIMQKDREISELKTQLCQKCRERKRLQRQLDDLEGTYGRAG